MKNKFTFLILSIIFLFFSIKTQAAHIIGGVMSYKCLGNDNYEITLKIYRDCQGGGAGFDGPANGDITIYNSPNLDYEIVLMEDPIISEIMPVAPNPCFSVPGGICVEEGIYTFNVNLPAINNSYVITYQRCCRNVSITNIINPSETGATYFVEITPDAQASCNNSPVFNEYPPIVICLNEPLSVDHSATDVEGDSLVYEFCAPLRGGGTAGWTSPGSSSALNGTNPSPEGPPPYQGVTFITPQYSPANPVGGDPQITINSETGEITGVPNTIGQFEVGVCVKEYRDGVVLSKIQRDFQFNVKECPPSINVTFDYMVVDELNFFFENNSVNATTYEWDFGDGNTSILEHPIHSYSQSGNYTVKLIGYDDNCNAVDEDIKEVEVIISATQEIEEESEITVFPNPNHGEFYLKLKSPKTSDYLVELWNVNGEKLNEISWEKLVGETVKSISTKQLSKGIYYLKINTDSEIIVRRIIVN